MPRLRCWSWHRGSARRADLTGIRQRGDTFQVRVFIGNDPVTGKKVMRRDRPTHRAARDRAAGRVPQAGREQTRGADQCDAGVPVGRVARGSPGRGIDAATYSFYVERFLRPALGDQTLVDLAQLGPRPYEQLYAQLRHCRRRCQGRKFIEHRRRASRVRPALQAAHVCTPLAASSIRQCQRYSAAPTPLRRGGGGSRSTHGTALKPRPPVPAARPALGGGRGAHRGRSVGRGRRTGAWSSGRHSSPAPAAGSCSRSAGRTSTSAAAR